MKKLFYLFIVAALFVACNNGGTKSTSEQKSAVQECSSISVDSFLVIAGDYVGKELKVQGTIDHVCKHGGKRVKLFSSCASKSIHGEAGEAMGNFPVEIEGSMACVTGVVAELKIDMAYVEEFAAKMKASEGDKDAEVSMGDKKGADHHAGQGKIEAWKAEIEASEKGYISSYYLEVSKYDLCAEKSGEDCGNSKEEKPCCADKKDSTVKADTTPCCEGKEKAKPCGEDKKAEKPCEESKKEAAPCDK